MSERLGAFSSKQIWDLLDKLEMDNLQVDEQGRAPELEYDSGLLSNLSPLVRRKSGGERQAVTELDLYCKVGPEIIEDANPMEEF